MPLGKNVLSFERRYWTLISRLPLQDHLIISSHYFLSQYLAGFFREVLPTRLVSSR